MYKYYFFQVARERNESGQLRKVFYPLHGQETYKTRNDRHHPIDTTYKLQLCNAQNHIACQLSSGVIFGVKHEGPNEKACRLSDYARNDFRFYRSEAEIFYVCDNDNAIRNYSIAGLRTANAEELSAYHALLASNCSHADENDAPAAATQTTSSPIDAPSTSVNVTAPVQTVFDASELNRVEDSLRMDMNERNALTKLLTISQIRDRMRIGVAKFTYEKQNGDMRVAYGTRNRQVMQAFGFTGENENNDSRENDGAHFHYYDIQRRAFRCFCTRDIRSVDLGFLLTDQNAIEAIPAIS